jgi:dipeptide/tripeptide permease
MQFFHGSDASIMVLSWHLGSVAVLSVLGGWLGERLLGWRQAVAAQ